MLLFAAEMVPKLAGWKPQKPLSPLLFSRRLLSPGLTFDLQSHNLCRLCDFRAKAYGSDAYISAPTDAPTIPTIKGWRWASSGVKWSGFSNLWKLCKKMANTKYKSRNCVAK